MSNELGVKAEKKSPILDQQTQILKHISYSLLDGIFSV